MLTNSVVQHVSLYFTSAPVYGSSSFEGLLAAAVPEFLGALAASGVVATLMWSIRRLRGRRAARGTEEEMNM